MMIEFRMWIDQYTDLLQQFLSSQIMLAPLLLLFIEEMGIPILVPGDAILAYVGYNIGKTNQFSTWLAFALGLLAVMGGASILFHVSRRWGHLLVAKLGRFLFINEDHIQKAEKLFAKYGALAIIFGRHIPGMRVPITISAAISGVRYRKFIICTFFSAVLWVPFYLYIGRQYGSDISRVFHRSIRLSLIIIGLVVVVVLALHLWGSRRKK